MRRRYRGWRKVSLSDRSHEWSEGQDRVECRDFLRDLTAEESAFIARVLAAIVDPVIPGGRMPRSTPRRRPDRKYAEIFLTALALKGESPRPLGSARVARRFGIPRRTASHALRAGKAVVVAACQSGVVVLE